MKKAVCVNCFEHFNFKPIIKDNTNFCSYKCYNTWKKQKVIISSSDWKKFVKMINEMR